MSSTPRIAIALMLAFVMYLIPIHGFSGPSILDGNSTTTVRRLLLHKILSEEHYFVPAVDHHIRYVGRWTPTPNLLRWEAAFPGAYIDLVAANASVIYLYLHNAPSTTSKIEGRHDDIKLRRMNFNVPDDRGPAEGPVVLTVRLCTGKTLHFSSSEDRLLAINISGITPNQECSLRVTYNGASLARVGTVQFGGVWLPRGAWLAPRAAIDGNFKNDSEYTASPVKTTNRGLRKTIEFVTDSSDCSSDENNLSIAGWLTLLSTKFDVDQVTIPVHNHCLTEACVKIQDRAISTQNMFFRSGPLSSSQFATPWNFRRYIPEMLILDLGSNDQQYLDTHTCHSDDQIGLRECHQSPESFANSFVNAYVSFIHQLRRTAYPVHPSALDSYDGDGYTYNSAPSTLPIFVMRPFDGSLEHATLAVVEQMQKDGDKSVFWIDTSGWITEADYRPTYDNQSMPYLGAAGHAKVMSFMHAHLCHYLAPLPEHCPFLRRDNYMGAVYVPVEAELDMIIEESRVKKLTDLFWPYA